MSGAAAGWVARRLPVADDDHRDELAASVTDVVAERPRCDRAWEAASLVGLWLRLWGRREGGDDARRALRQGVYLGGVVLMFVASTVAWSRAVHLTGPDGPGTLAAVAGAVLASTAAVLGAGGWRAGAVAAAAGSLVAGALAPGSVLAVGAVGALALLVGDRFGGRRCWRGLAAGALAAALLAGAASSASPDLLPAGALVALVGLPVGFLAVGWFDPRFAVAAAVAWLGAMVAVTAFVGPAWSQVAGDASAWLPSRNGWWAMGTAVVVAGLVSRAALRRSFGIWHWSVGGRHAGGRRCARDPVAAACGRRGPHRDWSGPCL